MLIFCKVFYINVTKQDVYVVFWYRNRRSGLIQFARYDGKGAIYILKFDRYPGNPILSPEKRNRWENFCVLNPAVCFDEKTNKFVMLYRAGGDDIRHKIRLGLATSDDGIHFERRSDEPVFDADDYEPDGGCIEDPRIVCIDGRYFITYAARAFAPGRYWLPDKQFKAERGTWLVKQPECSPQFIKVNHTVTYLAYTDDFVTYKKLGRITDSRLDDRDVVLFPRKINGKFVRISRPEVNDEKAMWIAYSDDIVEWGKGEVLYRGTESWEGTRIGAGCPPVETDKGWLLIYHGVDPVSGIYRVGVMLLDKDNPSKILARTRRFVMEPELGYETSGLYNGCVFPTGVVERDGTLYIYYGCADKFVALATVKTADLIEELSKEENLVGND